MNTNYEFPEALDEGIVYVRDVAVEDLPEEVQEQAEGAKTLFAVHNAKGEPLALAANRREAFFMARENNLAPVSVH